MDRKKNPLFFDSLLELISSIVFSGEEKNGRLDLLETHVLTFETVL